MKMNLNEFNNGKIAATYDSSSETIFQHFGKTQNFKIYTIEDGKIVKSEVMDNGGFGHHDLATYLKNLGIQILILGNRGQGAIDALNNAGIQQLAGITGSPDEAVKLFLEGKLRDNPDVKCNHHGEHHHHEETSGGMIFKPIK